MRFNDVKTHILPFFGYFWVVLISEKYSIFFACTYFENLRKKCGNFLQN